MAARATGIPTTTKHSATCKRVFGRYDMTCDRCLELRMGFGARRGWVASAFAARTRQLPEPAHPSTHRYEPNPGGYCIVCGWGRDHS